MNLNLMHLEDKPLISVVMATYNGEQFIQEAIKSVLKQSFKNFEFIIVDDGSTDKTPHIIASFEDNRIRYIKKENNSGIANSLNLGISLARGKYIARMDDDDVSMSSRLERQILLMEENNDIIFCATNVTLNKIQINKLIVVEHNDIKMAMLFNNPIVHPTVMIRKSSLFNFEYDPNKVPSEDYDLWSRLIWEGKFHKIKEPLLYYRYRKDSETSKRRKEQLALNAGISQFMFNKMEFNKLVNNEENIKIFASHDYSITGDQLSKLVRWLEELKRVNANKQVFNVDKFNRLVNFHLERFLISYFMNRKLIKKLFPFYKLNFGYKKKIIKYYFNKYF